MGASRPRILTSCTTINTLPQTPFDPRPNPSRRSFTKLSHLSLAPLTTRFPIDGVEDSNDAPDSAISPFQTHRSSYLQGKSAPTTPGILSRSASPTRNNLRLTSSLKAGAGSRSHTHLAYATARLPRAKSTIGFVQQQQQQQQHGQELRQKLRKRSIKSAVKLGSGDGGEWLVRAGTAISAEARESKGQSWLVSRASSTSLVAQDLDDGDEDDDAGAYFSPGAEDGIAVASARASRAASARTSRRASRVASRADLTYFTTGLQRTQMGGSAVAGADYFDGTVGDSSVVLMGPDFVDADEGMEEELDSGDEEEKKRDEAEVARLTSDRGFGLGSMVDRLIGWTLFDVREDRSAADDEETLAGEQEGLRNERTESARITAKPQGPKTETVGESSDQDGQEGGEAAGGWSDAAWLLSVASKVIL